MNPMTDATDLHQLLDVDVQEWAYARAYRTAAFRAAALPHYLRFYNTERRHTALGYTTPLQRLAQRSVNNVLVINT